MNILKTNKQKRICQEEFGLVSNIYSRFFPLFHPCRLGWGSVTEGHQAPLDVKNSEETFHLLHLSPVATSHGFSLLVAPCGISVGAVWLPSPLCWGRFLGIFFILGKLQQLHGLQQTPKIWQRESLWAGEVPFLGPMKGLSGLIEL